MEVMMNDYKYEEAMLLFRKIGEIINGDTLVRHHLDIERIGELRVSLGRGNAIQVYTELKQLYKEAIDSASEAYGKLDTCHYYLVWVLGLLILIVINILTIVVGLNHKRIDPTIFTVVFAIFILGLVLAILAACMTRRAYLG